MHLKEEDVSSFSLLPLQNSALFPGLALGNSYIVLAEAFQKIQPAADAQDGKMTSYWSKYDSYKQLKIEPCNWKCQTVLTVGSATSPPASGRLLRISCVGRGSVCTSQ